MHNFELTAQGCDCDEVLADIRERRQRLHTEMKRLQDRHAAFKDQRAALRDHAELLVGERAMLKYRQAHPL